MERWLESFARAAFLRSSDTAHDLKTPLNVAVLNLELLRMRVRKLTGESDDQKLADYASALETELRRMARVFDTFFLLSTPPRNEGPPAGLNIAPLWQEVAGEMGYSLAIDEPAEVVCHESRIRQALVMFFEGASKVLKKDGRALGVSRDEKGLAVTVTGEPAAEDFELTKILKFYYTDPHGNPDVSLAAARLIAETYGGDLIASQESDKVSIRLSVPLGKE